MTKNLMTLAAVGFVAAAFTFAGGAAAQDGARGFSVQLFQAAPGPDPFLTVEDAFVRPKLSWSVGMLIDYQHKPLVLRTCGDADNGTCGYWGSLKAELVRHHLSMDVYAGISLYRVLEVNVVLPVVLYAAGDGLAHPDGTVLPAAPSESTGMDDIRLDMKLDLLHGIAKQRTGMFGLALIEVLTIPVGNHIAGDSFFGDSFATAHTKLAFTVDAGRVRVGLNVGYLWRDKKEFYFADMGHRLTYALALEVRIWKGLSAIAETFGQNGFTRELASTPLEIDGALRYRLASGLFFTLGAGGGIIGAVGSPTFRVFGGLAFAPPVKPDVDTDKDGIVDEEDRCPLEPEDKDEFEDADGCPDPDNDKDGILDGADRCPLEPEDRDEFEDADGCPDPDNDKDGILDGGDICPLEAEDKDGFQDDDGCPEPDNDNDGILDGADVCPQEPEDKDDWQDDDGCPDGDKPLVILEKKEIKITEQINFKLDSDVIVGKKSFDILDAVVAILKENPGIDVRIEGHTDNGGTHTYNMDLSRRRAKAVKKYLVDHGINGKRLTAVGLGPDKPVADNATDEGRAKNRRVEFHIVEKEPAAPAPPAAPPAT